MGKKTLHVLGLERCGMSLAAEMVNIAENPLAIGLFGTVGVMMVPENLTHLVHELEFWIGPEFWFAFHIICFNIAISGKSQAIM